MEELDIRRPDWYPHPSVTNNKSQRERYDIPDAVSNKFPEASSSQVKNLMSSFNEAHEKIPGTHVQDETITSDEDVDENDAHSHRGEYLTDDEEDIVNISPDLWKGYMDLGPPTKVCQKCK